MLSEHDLPVGLQGHLLAESDCGRLQLSRSRRGRRASVWRGADSLYSPHARTWPAASRQPHSCTSTTLFQARPLNVFTLGVLLACNQYSLPPPLPPPPLLLSTTGAPAAADFIRMAQTQRVPAPLAGADQTAGDNDFCRFQDRDILESSPVRGLSSPPIVSPLCSSRALFSNDCGRASASW